jgi:hypothetical protein
MVSLSSLHHWLARQPIVVLLKLLFDLLDVLAVVDQLGNLVVRQVFLSELVIEVVAKTVQGFNHESSRFE